MHSHYSLQWTCVCFIVAIAAQASAQDVDRYREFRLAGSSASVIALTGVVASELRTVHARPALMQELTWRPRYATRRTIPDVDPVREIVFSFYDDQLYRIAVEYDQTRTAGLTDADIIGALTPIYGAQATAPLPRPRASLSPSGAPILLAQWPREDASVSLYKVSYSSVYSLVISSAPLSELARSANLAAVALNAREAPMREAARVKQQAEDAKAAETKAGDTNRRVFRP